VPSAVVSGALRRRGLALLLAALVTLGFALLYVGLSPATSAAAGWCCWEEEQHYEETILEGDEEEFHELYTNRSLRINLKVPGAFEVDDTDGYLENHWCESNLPYSRCGLRIPLGHSVLLTPRPPQGSVFTGWEGICSGTGTCEVTMSEDREVTANFVDEAPPLVPRIFSPQKGELVQQPADSGVVVSYDADQDPGTVRFLCRLDTSDYRPCGWSWTTKHLKPGPHTVRVRAVDGMGNASTPATRRFTVVH
jgi:Divergent InlB B-repeat domain